MIRSCLGLAAVTLAAALAGCATAPPGAMLTYETEPLGATLYEGTQSIGVAPVTRTYAADASGDVRTPDVTAVWPSGAKTSFWTNLRVGDDRATTLLRPSTAPNLAVDQENARQFVEAAKRDAERAKNSALSDVARGSARCKAQQRSGPAVIDDCK